MGLLAGLGWLAGLVFLWGSRAWTTRDKWIGTLVLPGGLAGSLLLIVMVVPPEGGGTCTKSTSGALHCTDGPGVGPHILHIALLVFVVLAPIVTTTYLVWRARSSAIPKPSASSAPTLESTTRMTPINPRPANATITGGASIPNEPLDEQAATMRSAVYAAVAGTRKPEAASAYTAKCRVLSAPFVYCPFQPSRCVSSTWRAGDPNAGRKARGGESAHLSRSAVKARARQLTP